MAQQAVISRNGSAVDETALETFRARLRGPLLRSGDQGYDEARTLWNAMIDRHPSCILRCTGAADVIAAVGFAREHDILLAVRGGGHNIAGTAICDGGMVIDLSLMKGVRVELGSQTVQVQPGCAWGDVDHETQPFGFAVPSGIVSTTGVSGLTLGGGFGWLTRKYGYTCDNLLSVDIVTADGRFLRASEQENQDLFWGVRGGGGNFGVVTSFQFRMRALGPTVMAGMVLHPIDRAREVIDFYRELTSTAPDELSSLLIIRIAPPAPFLPKEVHGKPVAGIAVCYAGPAEEGVEAVRPLKEFGSPLVDLIGPKPFSAHQTMLDAAQPPGRHYYWKSEYLHSIEDGARDVMLANTGEFPSPESALLTMHLGGAMSRVKEEDMAVGHRDVSYIVNIAASCVDPAKTQGCVSWAREFWSAVRPYSTGGVYVNFLTEDEGQDRVTAAYGPKKYDRLVALKNKYDPSNLFRLNQNIRPTV